MAGYRCVNYFDLCRLCTASHGGKNQIFSEDGKQKKLQEKISTCLPVMVEENDKLPKIICTQCLTQVENFYQFRETCVNAQTMLESCLNSSKLRNGGKVYIKDVVTPKAKPTIIKTTIVTPTATTTTTSTKAIGTKTVYQKQTTKTTPSSSDCLSSIVQEIGIPNMDEITIEQPVKVQQEEQQYPQYSIYTIDGNALKSGSIKIAPSQGVVKQKPQIISQSTLSQVDEFLKLKKKPITTVRKPASQVKKEKVLPATPVKKQNINLVLTTNNNQQQQPTQPQQNVQIQHLTTLTPSRCYLPITVKDSNDGQQYIAQFDTKNNVIMPTTTYLQMKLPPQLTTSNNQNVLLTTGGVPIAMTGGCPNNYQITNVSTDSNTTTSYPIGIVKTSNQRVYQIQTIRPAQPNTVTKSVVTNPVIPKQEPTVDQIQYTQLSNVPMASNVVSLPNKSGITIQRIKVEPSPTTTAPTTTTTITSSQQKPVTIAKVITTVPKPTRTYTRRPEKALPPDVPTPICNICSKEFKRKEHLTQHLKLHLGLRPFRCEEPNCQKAFSRKEHLMRHTVSHTGRKMFSCEFCEKLFSRKDNLNKHKRNCRLHLLKNGTASVLVDVEQLLNDVEDDEDKEDDKGEDSEDPIDDKITYTF